MYFTHIKYVGSVSASKIGQINKQIIPLTIQYNTKFIYIVVITKQYNISYE